MTSRDALLRLRADAIRRGMPELAMVYGWSVLRDGNRQLESEIAEIVRRVARTEENGKA